MARGGKRHWLSPRTRLRKILPRAARRGKDIEWRRISVDLLVRAKPELCLGRQESSL